MTREEAINLLKQYIDYNNPNVPSFYTMEEAIKVIIEALEQEPKTGRWIYDNEYSDWFDVTYKCSCCERVIIVPYGARNEVYKDYPYCHCGAKMAESEEEK